MADAAPVVKRDSAFLTQYPVPPTPVTSIKHYVELCGGTRVIEKVLIANNGNAAVKMIRSVRNWAFHTTGDSRAVQFVVMATSDDLKVCLWWLLERKEAK
jgi:acetyl-CoA carboxylase / biotin carboxylase 1